MVNAQWITVAQAAALMEIGKRGALKRLVRLNAQMSGRLLRKMGDKRMPRGVQASKYFVSLDVLRESMAPELEVSVRELSELRAEQLLMAEKLEALARAHRRLARRVGANAT